MEDDLSRVFGDELSLSVHGSVFDQDEPDFGDDDDDQRGHAAG